MLRKKLKMDENAVGGSEGDSATATEDFLTSKFFKDPFWSRFYKIENRLNEELKKIELKKPVTHVYNPIEYAAALHCAYLRKFLDGPKEVMFIGMNPGPNGMTQTGIPFGNIATVRDLMQLNEEVGLPDKVHPKRPVTGLKCEVEEPSGNRIWGLILKLSGDLDVFAKHCFIHNFCPLTFFDDNGKNLTPSELKGEAKAQIRDVCLDHLDEEIDLVSPKIIIAIGTYVDDCLKVLRKRPKYEKSDIKFLKLAHPSPRSLNNTNWPEKAESWFEENDLMKYIKGQI